MKTAIAIVCAVFIMVGCNTNTISKSDVDLLTDSQLKKNEEILHKMNSFLEEHGQKGFESQFQLVKNLQTKHDELVSFLKSTGSIDKRDLSSASNQFFEKTFSDYEISISYPILITEQTPLELIKLQLVNCENLLLREYEDGINFRFNNMEAVVILDKLNFKENEPITGLVSMMAYSTDLELKAKVAGSNIQGLGKIPFTIEPALIKDQDKLTVEVLFPNKVYTTSITINKK